jgi:hypothetical protein
MLFYHVDSPGELVKPEVLLKECELFPVESYAI